MKTKNCTAEHLESGERQGVLRVVGCCGLRLKYSCTVFLETIV